VPLAKNEEPYVAACGDQGSTIQSVKDLRGKTVLMPPSETFTTALIETYLKEQGLPFVDLDKGRRSSRRQDEHRHAPQRRGGGAPL